MQIKIFIMLRDFFVKNHYRFTNDVLPTATSPMTITLEILRVKFLFSQVRLIKLPKSLSVYGVISDEKGGGQSIIYSKEIRKVHYNFFLNMNHQFQQTFYLPVSHRGLFLLSSCKSRSVFPTSHPYRIELKHLEKQYTFYTCIIRNYHSTIYVHIPQLHVQIDLLSGTPNCLKFFPRLAILLCINAT